jgi:hypothetical protein
MWGVSCCEEPFEEQSRALTASQPLSQPAAGKGEEREERNSIWSEEESGKL